MSVKLTEIVGSATDHLLSLSVGGLKVLGEIFEHEVNSLAGPKGKHDPDRCSYRHGHEERTVTLGGRRVRVARPRVRSKDGSEVLLSSFDHFSGRDPLDEYTLGAILAGVSNRRYEQVLEDVGQEGSSTGRSRVSRRVIKGSKAKLEELFSKDLSNLLAMFIDGKRVGSHLLVVALGVDAEGRKHPLGLWVGSTENKTVCSKLLDDLDAGGLDTEKAMLFVIDGSKAIYSAIRLRFGDLALIQRCRKHKKENMLDHLPVGEKGFIGRKLEAAWKIEDTKHAESELRAIIRSLKLSHPGAAGSLLEGLEETLTVTRLGLTPSLQRTFKSTNPIESMISISRDNA